MELSRRLLSLAVLAIAPLVADGCVSDDSADDGRLSGTLQEQLARARSEFDGEVLPILTASCNGCHEMAGGAGPAFLAPSPDSYTRLLASGLVVPGKPDQSRLVSYGQSSSHPGTKLTGPQADTLSHWIFLEPERTQSGPASTHRAVAPFPPTVGDNMLGLSGTETTLQGVTISFRAVQVGESTQGLLLDRVAINGGTSGVHLVHPLFSTICPGSSQVVDPLDSFSGIDLTVNAGASKPLGGGSVALLSYRTGCRLAIDFELLALPGGALANGCKDVPAFVANFVAPLQAQCVSCHGGANAGATQGLDLRNLQTAAEQAAICGRVKGKTTVTNPAMSRLLQRVAPGQQTGHPFTLPGANELNQLRDALGRWLGHEQ